MLTYRLSVDASLYFSVPAETDTDAFAKAERILAEIDPGLDVRSPLLDEGHVYVNPTPNLAVEDRETTDEEAH